MSTCSKPNNRLFNIISTYVQSISYTVTEGITEEKPDHLTWWNVASLTFFNKLVKIYDCIAFGSSALQNGSLYETMHRETGFRFFFHRFLLTIFIQNLRAWLHSQKRGRIIYWSSGFNYGIVDFQFCWCAHTKYPVESLCVPLFAENNIGKKFWIPGCHYDVRTILSGR